MRNIKRKLKDTLHKIIRSGKSEKGDVYIIWDNLNTHLPYQWVKFNEKQKGRFHFIYSYFTK